MEKKYNTLEYYNKNAKTYCEQTLEGKYYNYITKSEMIKILQNLNRNVKLIDYFETLPSTKRIAKNTIWGNFIIKKFE